MSQPQVITKLAIIALFCMSFGAVQAADQTGPDAKRPAPTKEQREQMAKMHEQMAACLRSDKTVRECREAMRAQCQQDMGEHCNMMGPMPDRHMNKQREDGGADAKPHQ